MEQTNYDEKIKLYCADWFLSYKEKIEPASVDLVLTSPPFGIFGNEIKEISWDKEVDISLLETTYDYILKRDGQIILFADLKLMRRLLDSFKKFDLRTYHIHQKSLAMAKNRWFPLPDAEFILIFKRKETRVSDLAWHPKVANQGLPYRRKNHSLNVPTRRMNKSKETINVDGGRWIKTCLPGLSKCSMKSEERSSHPCQLSESILRTLIRTYSNEGDIVLDNYAGSASTLISAYKEDRRGIGFEKNSEYYNESVQRISTATNQINLFQTANTESTLKQEVLL